MSNLAILKPESSSILSPSQFLEKLEDQNKLHTQALIKDDENQLKTEYAICNRFSNALVNSILSHMIRARNTDKHLSVDSLLGYSGVEYYKNSYIREYNGWIGFVEKTLRDERLLNDWFGYSSNLKKHLRKQYGPLEIDDLKIRQSRPIRYYRVSDSSMKAANKNKNTYIFAIFKEMENILTANGYTVKNTIELKKWKDSKSTVYYTGTLYISAK
ncbi:MAG: hypothetical protein H8E74_01170 [Gammaproteobacteria bacterium]|nr:hypothetical protein [Gammaproteobacteria bacterium]